MPPRGTAALDGATAGATRPFAFSGRRIRQAAGAARGRCVS